MKMMIFVVVLLFLGWGSIFAQIDRSEESIQVAIWENNLKNSSFLSDKEKLDMFWLGLRNMAHRKSFSESSQDVEDVYQKIQKLILEIPGHAQYFADEVERIRTAEKKWLPGKGPEYNSLREIYLGSVLSNLPSPETVKVLGHYLDDERDTPSRPELPPENSWIATCSFSSIGLRNVTETSPVGFHRWREAHANWKTWYAKIKDGEMSFSFKGQNVEYRFKPDGSWEEFPYTGPPDPPKVKESKAKWVSEISKPAPVKQDWKKHWPWLAGAVALLVVIIGWFRRSAKAA